MDKEDLERFLDKLSSIKESNKEMRKLVRDLKDRLKSQDRRLTSLRTCKTLDKLEDEVF